MSFFRDLGHAPQRRAKGEVPRVEAWGPGSVPAGPVVTGTRWAAGSGRQTDYRVTADDPAPIMRCPAGAYGHTPELAAMSGWLGTSGDAETASLTRSPWAGAQAPITVAAARAAA